MKYFKCQMISACFLMFGFSFSFAVGKADLKGNGVMSSKTIEANNITQIECVATFNIILKSSEGKNEIKFETDENLIQYVKYEIKQNIITFNLVAGSSDVSIRPTKANIYIYSNQITSIENAGVGDILIEKFKFNKTMSLLNKGVGSIKLSNVEGDTLIIHNSGVGNSVIKGKLKTLKLYNQGVGNINASEMPADKVIVENNAVGNVSANATKEIYLECNGNGLIEYKGNPVVKKSVVGKQGKIKNIK